MHMMLRAIVEGLGGVKIDKAKRRAVPVEAPSATAKPFTEAEFNELVAMMGGVSVVQNAAGKPQDAPR